MAKADGGREDRYHHGELREALVAAAIELLGEKGLEAIALREVARRAGVSHAAPYHHFADKEALLAAVAEEGFVRMQRALEKGRERARDPLRALEAMGRAYVAFAAEHPAHFQLMFRLDAGGHSPQSEQAGLATFDVMRQQVVACLGDSSREADRWSAFSWALVHGIATLWIDGPLRIVSKGHPSLDAFSGELIRQGLEAFPARRR